ncbi:hypothetical protein Daura_08965 [Dactylosporangium aurantiacum]|uniref:Uncharacterized protein n=1 Tax=Dactylosporangium aurantiacum TaxID=35754 RepID=A0A9Q9IM01_9ACTN|nr:hypothetical protein [Dactylosporangium aurantiacum]MDG6109779.1 hypothetical protein [Dactylosporangium aurantiacum]UWZ56287.1 hypothetical protein Daura_08965 [Dactylosporangium aurantiacum]
MTAQWKKGKRRAESVAEDAWDYLVSAVESARSVGGSVKDRAYDIADEASSRYSSASDRVGSVADEAWHRANLAFDALSGRKQRQPWGWLAVAVLGGIAVGWAVAASAPKAIQAAQERFEDEEDVPSPTYEAPAPYRVAE